MKKFWAFSIILALLVIAVILVSLANSILQETHEASINSYQPQLQKYHYHFVMITQNSPQMSQAYLGAKNTANWAQAALEYYNPSFLNSKESERFLEMAVLSSVDGIILSVPNEPVYQSLINEASSKNIPIVTIGNDIDGCLRSSFVGVDPYKLGYKSGQALGGSVHKPVQIAVLVNSNFSTTSYQHYLEGLKKALQNNPRLNLKLIIDSKGESISAEEQAQLIIRNHPEIEVIICSDPNDTLGVAKVVVDLNRVTQVTIIGTGLTPEIANYIKRGVVLSVLTDDPYELGVQGLNTLIRIKEKQAIKESYYMPIFQVTPKNILEFVNRYHYQPTGKQP